jgi:hypothetical protein
MEDVWATGIITIASTLIGTLFGVLLPKFVDTIDEYFKSRKAKRIVKTQFVFKMLTLRSAMKAIQEEVNECPKITGVKELDGVFNILRKIDLNKELKDLNDLFENSFTPDLKHFQLVAHFKGFDLQITNILLQIGKEDGPQYFSNDIKPILTKQLNIVVKHIETINEMILSV